MTSSNINGKPVAIVLGGTNPHKQLIVNLKERGYFTVLIDYLENPSAKEVADHHVQESTLDKDKVLEIANQFQPKLILSICIDQANGVASYVSEKLGLPVLHSFQSTNLINNKLNLKKFCVENKINTAPFIEKFSIENLKVLNLPLVIKPVDTTGSKGVLKIENLENLSQIIDRSRSFSPSQSVFIEEFVEGTEVQVDCFVTDGKATTVMFNVKNKLKTGADAVMQSIGSTCVPKKYFSNAVTEEFSDIAQNIVNGLSLKSGPFFFQALIKDQKVYLIEFALRIGGGLSYKIIPTVTGFDTLQASLDVLLGLLPRLPESQNQADYFATNNIYVEPGKFGEIEFDTGMDHSLIEFFIPYKTKGAVIGAEFSSNNRIGAFITKGKSISELKIKAKQVYGSFKVLDVNGKQLNHINLRP